MPRVKKGPATPQHHGGCQQKLQPLRRGWRSEIMKWLAGQQVTHRIDSQRYCKQRADPETACHVLQFALVVLTSAVCLLQCHTANGTPPGRSLPYFRVHRAGVNRSGIAFWHRVIFVAFVEMVFFRTMAMHVVLIFFHQLSNNFQNVLSAIARGMKKNEKTNREIGNCILGGAGKILLLRRT